MTAKVAIRYSVVYFVENNSLLVTQTWIFYLCWLLKGLAVLPCLVC